MQRWSSLRIVATSAILAVATHAPRAATAGTRWGRDYFPNVELTTQEGRVVHLWDDLLDGKVVAIDLVYTSCRFSCPLETARLAQVQRLLGDRVGRDIHFYSLTLDPERDTPAVLKAYADKFHAGPGWLFLTGRKADILLVARKLGLLSWGSTPVNRDGHTPELMIGDVAAGNWMRNSAVDDPRLLATTIRTFLAGARAEPPGTPYAEARALSVTKGQYLFRTRCSACHTIGDGDAIGPDLLGVTGRRERGWLARFIQFPDRVLAERDPVATALRERFNGVEMPNARLGPDDVAALLDHLEQRAGAARSGASTARSLGASR